MDEIGELIVTAYHLPGEWPPRSIRIKRADPRVRINPGVLDEARSPDTDPNKLNLDGDVLTIRDDYGQRFIYRVRWDDYRDGGYLAEWPD